MQVGSFYLVLSLFSAKLCFYFPEREVIVRFEHDKLLFQVE